MNEYKHIDKLMSRFPELRVCMPQVTDAIAAIAAAFESNNKVLICGNGGSNSDADHIVGELMKGFCKKRPLDDELKRRLKAVDSESGTELADCLQMPLRAISLSQHVSLNTAFSNDVDADMMFAQQVLGYGDHGDVLLAISTSGNARNVYMAAIAAKAKDLSVILLSGNDGGRISEVSDISIIVPSVETHIIQEYHLPIYHTICLEVEDHFFES